MLRRKIEALVRFGKYAPLGQRGISTMRPHSNYNPGKLSEYTVKANSCTLFFAQIKTALDGGGHDQGGGRGQGRRPAFLRRWEAGGMALFSCNSELGLLKKGIQAMIQDVRGG